MGFVPYRLMTCRHTNKCWLVHRDDQFRIVGEQCKCKFPKHHVQVSHPNFVEG